MMNRVDFRCFESEVRDQILLKNDDRSDPLKWTCFEFLGSSHFKNLDDGR